MQKFEFKSLYNTKTFGKTFYKGRRKYLQQCVTCSKG